MLVEKLRSNVRVTSKYYNLIDKERSFVDTFRNLLYKQNISYNTNINEMMTFFTGSLVYT